VAAGTRSFKKRLEFRLTVPHKGFNRQIGALAGLKKSPGWPRLGLADLACESARVASEDDDRSTCAADGASQIPGKFANGSRLQKKASTKGNANSNIFASADRPARTHAPTIGSRMAIVRCATHTMVALGSSFPHPTNGCPREWRPPRIWPGWSLAHRTG